MTVAHIYSSPQTEYGSKLHSALAQLEAGFQNLIEIRDTFTTMIDGDGSDPAQYTYAQAKFGFTDNATAQEGWNELNSVLAKLTTDSSVTSVNSAILQVFKKFR